MQKQQWDVKVHAQALVVEHVRELVQTVALVVVVEHVKAVAHILVQVLQRDLN